MPQRALKARVIIWRAPEGGPELRAYLHIHWISHVLLGLTAPVQTKAPGKPACNTWAGILHPNMQGMARVESGGYQNIPVFLNKKCRYYPYFVEISTNYAKLVLKLHKMELNEARLPNISGY